MSILLDKKIITRQEPLNIRVIGVGGTGSHMLVNLAMIDYSLKQMDMHGLEVVAYDPDIVEPVNVGRQMFTVEDIGENKAIALMRKINFSYGLTWKSIPEKFNGTDFSTHLPCIYISCVDSVKSRMDLDKYLKSIKYRQAVYWIDIGNSNKSGQIIVGYSKEKQTRNKEKSVLPFITERYDLKAHEKPEEPSCSMSASLKKQDLFINKIMADYTGHMLWSMLRNNVVNIDALFVNLESFSLGKNIPK